MGYYTMLSTSFVYLNLLHIFISYKKSNARAPGPQLSWMAFRPPMVVPGHRPLPSCGSSAILWSQGHLGVIQTADWEKKKKIA